MEHNGEEYIILQDNMEIKSSGSPNPPLADAVAVATVMEQGNLSSPDSTTSTVQATHSNDMDKGSYGNTLEHSKTSAFETISEEVNQ